MAWVVVNFLTSVSRHSTAVLPVGMTFGPRNGGEGEKRMLRRGGTSQPGVSKNLEMEKLREF